jgi:nucleotidyltransferase/DNA polymerase involved in DNA repair
LRWFGFKSVGEVRELSRELLIEQFAAEGEAIFRYAHGTDRKPVELFSPDAAFGRDHERKNSKHRVASTHKPRPSFIVRWKTRAGFAPHDTAHEDKTTRMEF